MLGSVVRGGRGRFVSAPLRWFGRHSDEVYLMHEFVVIAATELLLRVHRGPHWLWAEGVLVMTAPLGWTVAHWLSEPANRALRGAAPPFHPAS